MISRRSLLGGLAALPLVAPGSLAAQTSRVGGARIVVLDNRVWMQVRFGGRGPYPFVIDTGAFTNLIRRDLVRELDLRQIGDRTLRGVGGRHDMGIYEARAVTLGTIDIGDADFAAYEQSDLSIHPEAMGALSTSILTVADAELDFERNEWRIYPDGRGERPGYERLPSEIVRSTRTIGAAPIHVEAEIGGESYRLQVDTGSPGQVLLFPRGTRRSGLWDDQVPYAPGFRRGVGGVGAASRLVRGPNLRIGSSIFERPLISLTDPETSDSLPNDGLLGIGIIERLNWSTDVRAGRVWARRSGVRERPERYGLTGMWLNDERGRLVVVALSPGSPAAEAGLRTGDEILGITLPQWIARAGGRPGESLPFRARRDGREFSGTLVLRAFL